MKKIVSVGMVKNESDIIESYTRYALTYSDNIVIFDADSSDNTIEILEKLKKEFKNRIIVFQRGSNDAEEVQDNLMNYLVNYAIKDLDADVIVPIDADEFLISAGPSTIREIIEDLPTSDCFTCKMRGYICKDIKPDSTGFLPLRYKYYSNPDFARDNTRKVIVHSEAWIKHKLSLALGNHDVSNSEYNYQSIETNKLLFAHYPIRSKQQAISKIVKYHIYSSIDFRFIISGAGSHMVSMYNYLKKNNFNMSDNELLNFSFYSTVKNNNQLAKSNLDKFCLYSDPYKIYPNIPIKYPINENNLYDTIFQGFSSLVSTYKSGNQKYYMKKMLSCIDDFGILYCYHCYTKSSLSNKKSITSVKLYFRLVKCVSRIYNCFNPKIQSILSNRLSKIRKVIKP